ncbi:MAG: hypothetical protein LBS34_01615 [Rickettsiales bacterium]|jgi:hypothetical protein|nr:hypothetical protein [Rickettsiales bacterium]
MARCEIGKTISFDFYIICFKMGQHQKVGGHYDKKVNKKHASSKLYGGVWASVNP